MPLTAPKKAASATASHFMNQHSQLTLEKCNHLKLCDSHSTCSFRSQIVKVYSNDRSLLLKVTSQLSTRQEFWPGRWPWRYVPCPCEVAWLQSTSMHEV